VKVLITPKSFKNYRELAYPLLASAGLQAIENNTGRTLSEEELISLAGEGVAGIIVGLDPLSERVIADCRDLRAISKYGVGLDNIDLVAAAKRNIQVKNALGSNNISVAELTIALMFEAARHVGAQGATVKAGRWERIMGMELTGKTMGLIGAGQIGREVAKRARGLLMKVHIFDPYFDDVAFLEKHQAGLVDNLEALLARADVISLHLPLTPSTKHLINRVALRLMKKSAVLINTSRGELVDEDALYEALTTGGIAYAASDVFSAEPPTPGEKLLNLSNFLLTPHTGAYTREANERMALYSTQNIITMLKR